MSDRDCVSMIVAAAENNVIGFEGRMPWRLSADLKNFKAITLGHTIIMGRKTWDSIQRLLPDRQTVIVSRNENLQIPGAIVVGSLDAALKATDDNCPFIVGGSEIYRMSLPLVSRIYLTRVHGDPEGDTRLPEIAWDQWQLTESRRFAADLKNSVDYSFEVYQRIA